MGHRAGRDNFEKSIKTSTFCNQTQDLLARSLITVLPFIVIAVTHFKFIGLDLEILS